MFWIDNPIILIDNYLEFIPNNNLSKDDNLNAITRFVIYFSVILFIFGGAKQYYYLSLFTLILIFLIYKFDDPQIESLVGSSKICETSTFDNPYGNPLLTDYSNNREKLKMCPNQDEKIESNFMHNLYMNSKDLFALKMQQRQFHTLPSSEIPNDQDSMAKWLYYLKDTCKSNNKGCLKYEDLSRNYKIFY